MRTIREFFGGIGVLLRGFRTYATRPQLMWLGALPALIVGLVYVVGIVAVAINLDALVTLVTPFARGWEFEPLVRIAAGLALFALVVILFVYTYAAITLAVGDVFYERIWRAVEESMGDAPPELAEGFWTGVRRGAGNGIRLLLLTVFTSLILFACGFIPVVGQTVVPVVGALFAGWFLSLELTGYAFDARGLRLRDRRQALGATRARTLGFGVACYLLLLVPFAAVVVMPAAVAGAAYLARGALTAAVSPPPAARSGSGRTDSSGPTGA
jgi:CysZ protein